MEVLNSLNCHKIDEIIKQQLMKVKKRNYNAHLTEFSSTKKSYNIENVVEEIDVICNNPLDEFFDIEVSVDADD
jgi:hypothetical protein